MWLKFTRLFAFLATFSLSGAYIITPNIIDGIPSGLDITNITDPFQTIGSNYYYFESNQLNWFSAFEACRRMKADLVAFDNYDELELVYQHIIRHKLNEGSTYWTSGTDLDIQHKHVWFSTGQPVTSNLWLTGEPNNLEKVEHCDELRLDGKAGLNDKLCYTKMGYICYKSSTPKTASIIIF